MSVFWFFLTIFLAIGIVKFARYRYLGEPLMPWRYSDGGRSAAGYRGVTGDCVVRSLAIVTGRPYKEVYDTVNQFAAAEKPSLRGKGSNARTGVRPDTMRKVMTYYGGVWTPTVVPGQKYRLHLREGELPHGRVVVRLSKHVAAIIDGVIYDNHDPQREGTRQIYGYWTFPERINHG